MVPDGWERRPLIKIAEVRTGVAKGKRGLKDPIEVPYLRVANVQDGHIDLSEIKTIQIERHQLERYSLKKGDVLMTEGGDFDKLGRGDVWQGQIEPCLNQNHVFAVRVQKDKILPYFLAALSGSNYGKTYFLSCAKRSTNLASINSTQLKEFPVPIPPLPEQRKIALILSTWDKAIVTTEKLIETSKKQKKALMQQLLTGQKRLINPETGVAFVEEWKEVKLRDLGKCITGLTYSPGDVVDDGLLVLRSSNVQDAKITFQDKVFVSKVVKETTKTQLGDILICVRNGSKNLIGKSAYITDRAVGLTHGAFMTLFRGKYAEYVFQLFQTDQYYRQVNQNLGATINSINTSNLHRFRFFIPDNEFEIFKIASVLTAVDKEIEILKAKLSHLQQEKKALMQQLLTGKRRVKVEEELEVAN